jgi:hypothetical protein
MNQEKENRTEKENTTELLSPKAGTATSSPTMVRFDPVLCTANPVSTTLT